MRLNRLFAVLVVPFATACGGGGNTTPTPVDTPPPIPDTPPAAGPCPVASLAAGAQVGTDAMPAVGDFYNVPTMGPNTGMNTFAFRAGPLPMGSGKDSVIIQFVSPFTTNVARPFLTDAASTASFQASAVIFGNLSADLSSFEYFLFAGSGTITMTAVDEAINGLTKGSVSMTTFREVDDAGVDVPGGCNTTMGGLSFVMQQNAAAQKPDEPDGDSESARLVRLMQSIPQVAWTQE